jgi:hypothetical protein
MSQLGGNDSKTVRYLVLMVAVMALVVGGLIFNSMRDAGDKEAQLEQRLSDKYGQDIEVRKDIEGGSHPSQVTIVTIDGTDRHDCEVTGPESAPTLDCAQAPRPTPGGSP